MTPLAELLAARIRTQGPITFAKYMRECLYHPEFGYYNRAELRRFPDYYTSVDVHPIFGRLLARQFREIWELLGRPKPFELMEVGAGAGWLAKHILDFVARGWPEFYGAVQYRAVESSEARGKAQTELLRAHPRFMAVPSIHAVEVGVVFSNEWMDALPVHRVVLQQSALREIYVALDGDRFVEQTGPLSTPALEEYFAMQGVQLLEGQQAEVCLEVCKWSKIIGRKLGRGFVVTIDYGHEARELYDERHMRGTLLAYHQHRAGESFYAAPGEQDLTAHVNWTALDLWGQRCGLSRTGLVSQTHFLMALGRANEFADLYDEGQSEAERVRARLLLKNLIYPEGMGETFSVFIQHKGIDGPRLAGLEPL